MRIFWRKNQHFFHQINILSWVDFTEKIFGVIAFHRWTWVFFLENSVNTSILRILEVQKTAISTHSEAVNIFLCEFMHFLKVEIYQNQKFRAHEIAKIPFLECLNPLKLISRKIWVREKSLNFHTVSYEWSNFPSSRFYVNSIFENV